MAGDISKANGRKGGRPRGPAPQTRQRTIDKRLALERMRERVYAEVEHLITSEIEAAKGSYVMLIKTETGGWSRATTEAQIAAALEAGAEVFRVVRKDADMRAVKDLWDRTIGVATQPIELSTREPVRIVNIYTNFQCPTCKTETADLPSLNPGPPPGWTPLPPRRM
jgi:hypothetical protein